MVHHLYGGQNTSKWAQNGRVLYVHGGGIDQPLGLVRMDYSFDFPDPTLIVPHANWRGTYETSTFSDGYDSRCKTVWLPQDEVVYQDTTGHMVMTAGASPGDLQQTRCIERDCPGAYMGMEHQIKRQTLAGPTAWMGSLVQDGQDASGLSYRRNRYYDANSGRFTQEDPSGIAGGLNVYGFAGGDPVSYSDPYGLCPVTPEDPVPCSLKYAAVGTVLGAAGGAVLGAGAGTLALPGGGTVAGGMAGWELGGTLGGMLGTTYGGALDYWQLATESSSNVDPGQPSLTPESGTYRPSGAAPVTDGHGQWVPDSQHPHTQIGTGAGRRGEYTKAAEFGHNGQPVREIEFTDHGRPLNHPNPHQHTRDTSHGQPGARGEAKPYP